MRACAVKLGQVSPRQVISSQVRDDIVLWECNPGGAASMHSLDDAADTTHARDGSVAERAELYKIETLIPFRVRGQQPGCTCSGLQSKSARGKPVMELYSGHCRTTSNTPTE